MGRNGSKWCTGLEDLEPFCFEKNVFLDRFRPFGCHFSAFRAESKNRNFFDFLTILGYFGPVLDPKMASGAPKDSGEPTKIGQKGVKRP